MSTVHSKQTCFVLSYRQHELTVVRVSPHFALITVLGLTSAILFHELVCNSGLWLCGNQLLNKSQRGLKPE